MTGFFFCSCVISKNICPAAVFRHWASTLRSRGTGWPRTWALLSMCHHLSTHTYSYWTTTACCCLIGLKWYGKKTTHIVCVRKVTGRCYLFYIKTRSKLFAVSCSSLCFGQIHLCRMNYVKKLVEMWVLCPLRSWKISKQGNTSMVWQFTGTSIALSRLSWLLERLITSSQSITCLAQRPALAGVPWIGGWRWAAGRGPNNMRMTS